MLANFTRQVSMSLRQPAVKVAASPAATGRAVAAHSSTRSTPLVRAWVLISNDSPALAPPVKLTVPAVNQSAG